MVWETKSEAAWARGLEAARRYHQRYGDMEVPPGYRDDQGFALGNWVRNIRTRYRTGALTRKQIEELEALGIVWNMVDSRWECCYAEAAAYYERHGNLEFPKHYVAESGLRLGAWLENQRIAYLKGELPADKAARLEAIGMLWEGRNDRQWQETYAAARRYFRQHGNLDIPYDYVSPEGFRLGQWVVRQRMAYKGTLSGKGKVNRKRLSSVKKSCWTLSGWTGEKKMPGRNITKICWLTRKNTAP